MLKTTKNILFYVLMIISTISFINIATLYWIPIQLPVSSYLATSLASTAYFLKEYYLIPISFMICILVFFSAFSFLKKEKILPGISFVYFLCELLFLICSFFHAWLNDKSFIAMQAVQMIISIIIVVLVCIYFVLLWKEKSIEQRR